MSENQNFSENLTLVSWENVKVKIPFALVTESNFFQSIPDLSQQINLDSLKIDTNTLETIARLLKYFSNDEESMLSGEYYKEDDDPLDYEGIFKSIGNEELLNLVLAAHALDLKEFQRACCMRIAEISKEEDEEFQIDESRIDEEEFIKFSRANFKD